MSAPWRDADTALGRAWRAAYDRIDAVSDEDAPGVRLDEQRIPLLFSGLDMDPDELAEYTTATARMAVLFMDNVGREIVTAADEAGEGRDVYAPRLRALTLEVMTGVAQTVTLAGCVYGIELERTTGTGKPLPGTVTRDQVVTLGRVPSIAERVELSRDSVQAVLEMEADRSERVALTLQALGIERAANLMTAAAAVIRYELSGGDAVHQAPEAVRRRQELEREDMEARHRLEREALDRMDEQ